MKFYSLSLLVILLLVSSAAFGQSVAGMGGSVQAPYTNTYVMQDHPQHATQTDLRPEVSLLGSNGVTVAHGERPLSDFPDDSVREVPLGTIARQYRTYGGKKAAIYWEQQGK